MARPRADQTGPSAQERLAGAFWEMLGERPFAEITIAALARRARVNHNTFYYHFDNLEDMARRLFDANMLRDLPRAMLPLLASGEASRRERLEATASTADVRRRFARACLFAASGSPVLMGILKASVMDVWLDTVGVRPDDLSQAQRDQLEFVFGGAVALLGELGDDVAPERLAALGSSPLGEGILRTLTAIATDVGARGAAARPS